MFRRLSLRTLLFSIIFSLATGAAASEELAPSTDEANYARQILNLVLLADEDTRYKVAHIVGSAGGGAIMAWGARNAFKQVKALRIELTMAQLLEKLAANPENMKKTASALNKPAAQVTAYFARTASSTIATASSSLAANIKARAVVTGAAVWLLSRALYVWTLIEPRTAAAATREDWFLSSEDGFIDFLTTTNEEAEFHLANSEELRSRTVEAASGVLADLIQEYEAEPATGR